MKPKTRTGDRHAVQAVSIRLSAEDNELAREMAVSSGILREDGQPDLRRVMTSVITDHLHMWDRLNKNRREPTAGGRPEG